MIGEEAEIGGETSGFWFALLGRFSLFLLVVEMKKQSCLECFISKDQVM